MAGDDNRLAVLVGAVQGDGAYFGNLDADLGGGFFQRRSTGACIFKLVVQVQQPVAGLGRAHRCCQFVAHLIQRLRAAGTDNLCLQQYGRKPALHRG